MSSFEDNMTAFYMAFAEKKLDPLCQSLANMRLHVHNDVAQQSDRAAAATTAEEDSRQIQEAEIRQEMLRACEMKASSLQDLVVHQLQQACADVNTVVISDLMHQFYLCVELGAVDLATPSFTKCLSVLFHMQANSVMDRVAICKSSATVNENGYIERNFYVEAMSEMLTGATDLMNAIADIVLPTSTGKETTSPTLQTILLPIQELSADVVQEILQLYVIDARMTAWERRAVDQARTDLNDEVESDESLQMVDLFLDELSFLIRLLTSYDTFLTSLVSGMDSGLKAKIQELNGVYLILEQFYIRQSVHKATEIAEVHAVERDVVLVSSSVEDVTFILNKAFFRATQCLLYYTVLAVVIAIVDALDSMYLPSILNLPNRSFTMPTIESDTKANPKQDTTDEVTTSFSDMLLAAVDDDLTKSVQEEAKLIMAINSSYLSGDFVEALQTKIGDYSKTTFPTETNLLECCPKPLQELVQAFRSIVENEIDQVLTQGIRKRLEPRIHRLMMEAVEYELSAAQYDAYGLQGSPINKLIERDVMQDAVLQRYQRALCILPFYDLVEALVKNLTTWIEQALVQSRKRCNDLGALQLEREVTAMLDRVSELVQQQRSLRNSFTRLFQIVLIINLLNPQDLLEYDVEELLTTFRIHEIDHWIRMRVEFKPDDIKRTMEKLQIKNT